MHSVLSHKGYDLHIAALYSCCAICILVFLALIYSLIKFRKSNNVKIIHFHKSLALEIFWTSLPFVILVVLMVPAVKTFF